VHQFVAQKRRAASETAYHNHSHADARQGALAPVARVPYQPASACDDPQTLEPLGQHVHRELRAPPPVLDEQREPRREARDPPRAFGDEEVDEALGEEPPQRGGEGRCREPLVKGVLGAEYPWRKGGSA
jgi:hypothetical protein